MKRGDSFGFRDIKIQKQKSGDFTQIPNSIIRERGKMSMASLFLLISLLSNRDGWITSAEGLAKFSKEGITAIKKYLRELSENGYLLRLKYRDIKSKARKGGFLMCTDDKGDFTCDIEGLEEELFEKGWELEPQSKNVLEDHQYIKAKKPITENHPVGFSSTVGNPPDKNPPDKNPPVAKLRLINTNTLNNNYTNNKEYKPSCAQSAHEVSVSLPLPSEPKKQLPRSWNTLNQQHPPEKVKALRDFYQLQKKQHPSVIGDVTPDSDYIQKGLETINKLERIDKIPWKSIKLVLNEVPFHKFWKTVIIVFHACRNKSAKTGLTKFQNALIAIQAATNAENKKELSYAVACDYCYREFGKEIGQIFIDLLEERLFERPDRAPGGSWTEEEQASILKAAVDLSCHLESKQTAEALQNEYIPRDIYLMELFYYWLTHEDQQWIDCISSSCFKPTGKIVQKFLSWCAQDCGYDILTGDCVR